MAATEQSSVMNVGRPAYARPLSDFAVRKRVSVDPKQFPDEEFELLSIPAYDSGVPEKLRGSEIGSTKIVVEPGDVLISRIIPHIQRVWIVPERNDRRQIASGEWIVFRGEDISSDFLRHMLLAKPFHDQFMQTVAGMGGSLLRARPRDVEQIEIPVPASLDDQRRIATILDKAHSIRRRREEALGLADAFLKSTFLEMFGDPSTNPKGWPIESIRDLVIDAKYGTSQKADVTNGHYPMLRMGNLTYSGEIDTSDLKYVDLADRDVEKYTVRRGDILFNRTNSPELVGKTAVFQLDDVYAYAGYLVRARVNQRANPHYISHYLNSDFGKSLLRGMCKSIIGMANINAQELQNIKIPVPPVTKQNSFGAIVERVDSTRANLRNELGNAEQLIASLSQCAFRGEL
jgi:type I restriction enzyme, S subunit